MTLLFRSRIDSSELRAETRLPVVINTTQRDKPVRFWRDDCSTRTAGVEPLIITRPLPRWKRTMDVVLASIGLIVATPLFAAATVLIRLTSRGPAVFAQKRAGIGGREFVMYKFRTMVEDAEAQKSALMELNEQDGPAFKLEHDPRMTRLGWFLRKSSIDELPQLWNVLVGEMSLVGPRPPIPAEVAQYDAWQRRRLSVRPGITCLWQVSGRNGIGFEQWMRLDMQYIDQWSLRKDFALLGRTIPAVLSGRGAS